MYLNLPFRGLGTFGAFVQRQISSRPLALPPGTFEAPILAVLAVPRLRVLVAMLVITADEAVEGPPALDCVFGVGVSVLV